MSILVENYQNILKEVTSAAAAAGRKTDDVKLLVVSKTKPVWMLKELYDAGVREFGENREPELAEKVQNMPGDVIWHFIGPVQSNKIRKVIKNAQVVHSISSLSQIEKFDRIAGEEKLHPEILLEVNVSGEESKGGLTPQELPAAAAAAAKCTNIKFRGLMTMAPFQAESAELKQIFSTLKTLRDQCEKTCNIPLPVLSMGMSGDFPEAISCGATIVRVGSKIFAGVEK